VTVQNDYHQHFGHSVTLEIQVRLYIMLAPDSSDVTSQLLRRSKRYKLRVGALTQAVRTVEWLWGEIAGEGVYDKVLVDREEVVNPYQNYLAVEEEGGEQEE